ncbi:MAG: hypothetical protein JKY95_11200 [Planctomycetaceae bacterium]|nr:hypothetical protein [Planctomycetaceae bacterium]
MDKKYYANLQPSEMAIFSAAANIFASHVATGKVNDDNENDIIKKSIEISMKIARTVDNAVQSDDEL